MPVLAVARINSHRACRSGAPCGNRRILTSCMPSLPRGAPISASASTYSNRRAGHGRAFGAVELRDVRYIGLGGHGRLGGDGRNTVPALSPRACVPIFLRPPIAPALTFSLTERFNAIHGLRGGNFTRCCVLTPHCSAQAQKHHSVGGGVVFVFDQQPRFGFAAVFVRTCLTSAQRPASFCAVQVEDE